MFKWNVNDCLSGNAFGRTSLAGGISQVIIIAALPLSLPLLPHSHNIWILTSVYGDGACAADLHIFFKWFFSILIYGHFTIYTIHMTCLHIEKKKMLYYRSVVVFDGRSHAHITTNFSFLFVNLARVLFRVLYIQVF